ncbi:iron chaperone [Nocardioides soli]|uniref:Uncharacterized protein YdhG (YjbR/CyaY superfamily) n=1 Tax=Nocardioides soli TaxID=1036020 RepID=A0A7W4Z3N1_9ACTN|nr:DUF1801 domain-containing protein [Nocardioides soli]MBB3045152.1 uncharacterized protein YdhG (YjbR/CyaY superfamily) [Nocardioides soli]
MATKSTSNTSDSGFSADEMAAMKQRAAELRAEKKRGAKKADEAEACVEAIMALPQPDRGLAEAIHRIVLDVAPELDPKTWYGFPSYARNGKVVVFFKPASKFKSRYATLGFEEAAQLDDGAMWVTSFAVLEVGPAEEKVIRTLVKKARG